jgi:hypothetical protein
MGVMMSGMDYNSIISPAVISTASLVSNAISSVKNAKDLIKDSQDGKLKSAVGEVLTDVLELKIRLLELDGENRELRQKLEERETLTRTSEFGYYFRQSQPDAPLCPKCYEGEGKLAHLSTPQTLGSGVRRQCHVCEKNYWEIAMEQRTRRVVSPGISF